MAEIIDDDSHEKRVVPWFSMAEWDQVYKQIFSDDTLAQVKGLEHLLVWKARCPQGIPAGAQCTLDLIQVCLKDREIQPQIANGLLPPYREYDLQQTYSFAIIRFLNHLSTLTERVNKSIYRMASKLNIPDWVVNIRHETAHGHNLPSLNTLRTATHLCLDWIHEHYWKDEAEMLADWIINDEIQLNHFFNCLKNIIDLWQAIMLYIKVGFTEVKKIPDIKLRQYLIEEENKFDKSEIKHLKKEYIKEGLAIENSEISVAQIIILSRLETCMNKYTKFEDRYNILVDVLIEANGFLPSSDFILMISTESDLIRMANDSYPIHFLNLWNAILEFLHKNNALHILLKKLIQVTNEIENEHRCKMAALWIKELALSIKKVIKIEKLVSKWNNKDFISNTEESETTFFEKLKSLKQMKQKKIILDYYRDIIEMENPDLQQVISLKIQAISVNVTDLKLVKDALQVPNPWTKIFIQSLMEIVEPPLPEETKEKLLTLVNLYTQDVSFPNENYNNDMIFLNQNHSKNSKIYKLHQDISFLNENHGESSEIATFQHIDLNSSSSEANNKYSMEVEETAKSVTCIPSVEDSYWIYCNDLEGWSKCPLGKLPTQCRESTVDMGFPCDTVWQPSKQSEKYISSQRLPGFFHKEINWERVLWKRQKNIPQEFTNSHTVETAFDTVLRKEQKTD